MIRSGYYRKETSIVFLNIGYRLDNCLISPYNALKFTKTFIFRVIKLKICLLLFFALTIIESLIKFVTAQSRKTRNCLRSEFRWISSG